MLPPDHPLLPPDVPARAPRATRDAAPDGAPSLPAGAVVDLDHGATTPALPAVIEAMAAAMREHGGNPSSLHAPGRAARGALERARARILRAIDGAAGELVFTSSGSEANALAVAGVVEALEDRARGGSRGGAPPRAVVSAIEHSSTRAIYDRLEAAGRLMLRRVAPDEGGRVAPRAVGDALAEGAAIVSLLLANNETGVLQDIHGAGEVCRAAGALLHCDAVHALGRVPLSLADLGADLVTISAHKIYGPRGAGALWLRRGTPFRHPWGDGPQEGGRRPGTEDLPSAVGFAAAIESLELPRADLGERLLRALLERCPGAVVNGDRRFAVPGTLNVSFPGVRADLLLIRLDLAGVRASSGAACSSGAREPSRTLAAMGLPADRVASAIRLTLGRGTTARDVDVAAAIIAANVAALREAARAERGEGLGGES